MDTRTENDWDDGTDPYGPPTYDDEAYPDDEPLIYGDENGAANPRRTQATIVMVLAGLFFIGSLVVLASFNVDSGVFADLFDFLSLRTWVWIFVAAMAAFLIWILILLFSTPAPGEEDWYSEGEDDRTFAEYADEPGAPDTITLRCPKCMTIFTLQDPWTRPFYHRCPTCEAQGVYTGVQDPPEVKAALERQGAHGA